MGENEIVNHTLAQFLVRLGEDIDKIKKLMPGVRLVWADMLPRHVWQGTWDPKVIDNLRSKLYKKARKITKWCSGVVIS